MRGSGDYISREAAEEVFRNARKSLNAQKYDYMANEYLTRDTMLLNAEQIIHALPAADARPVVRAKWIPDYDYAEYDYDGSTPLPEPLKFQDGWQCSLCGGYMPSETNFCPNCGADMREES